MSLRFTRISGLAWLLCAPAWCFAGPESAFKSDEIDAVFQLSLAPAGITATPDGDWILSVDQTEKPRTRVVKVGKSGTVEPFPDADMSDALPGEPLPFDAVEGLQLDAEGLVWLLDNGRRGETTPKVVAWNYDKKRLHWVGHIGQPAVITGSFLSDLAVDPNHSFVYISDPANGTDAALIVLDRATGLARRVLQGHASVVPDESVPMTAGRGGVESRRLDGSQALPHCGVDPIALDRKGEWLYYAPLRSHRLYRIRAEVLRDAGASPDKISKAVEIYADKPPTSSITVDNKGNVYAGDIPGRAIGVIDSDKRQYRVLTSDPRLLWPDGLCFGGDGRLYFYSRARLAPGSRPSAVAAPAPHTFFRTKPLAPGRVGD